MKGLKKTSPLETHVGISIYWKTALLPKYTQYFIRQSLLSTHLKTLLIIKKEKDRRKKKSKKKYYKKTADTIATILPIQRLYLPFLYRVLNLRLISNKIQIWKLLNKKNAFKKPMIPISMTNTVPDKMTVLPQRLMPLVQRPRFKKTLLWILNIERLSPRARNLTPNLVSFTGIYRKYNQWHASKMYTYDQRAMYLDLKKIITIPWLWIKLGKAKYSNIMITTLHIGMLNNNFSSYMIICKKAIESTKKKHYTVWSAIKFILSLFFQMRRNLLGYQMFVSGTIGRHGRSKIETARDGKLSLGTLREKFGYSSIQCLTKFGNIGMKFWCEMLVIEPVKSSSGKKDDTNQENDSDGKNNTDNKENELDGENKTNLIFPPYFHYNVTDKC